MRKRNVFWGKMIKIVATFGLAAALFGAWNGVSSAQAAGNTYPIPMPVPVAPSPTAGATATASPTVTPSYGPSDQYKRLNIKTSGSFDYTVVDETNKYASIVKIKNYGEEIIIPDTIDGYKVIYIGVPYDAEYDNEDLTSEDALALFPDRYTKDNLPNCIRAVNYVRRCVIDYYDFKVKSLKIPEGVTMIKEGAFGYMYSLSNIELPKSLFRIDDNNFSRCQSLAEIVFKGDIRIGSAFYGTNFNKITAYGSFSCGEEEVSAGIYGSVKQFVFDKEAFENCQSDSMVISMYSLGIKELVIPKDTGDVKTLCLDEADIDKIVLGNPKLAIKGTKLNDAFNKTETTITKVKSKYNKKTRKYTYTWNKIKCNIKNSKDESSIREVSVKYTLYKKNKKGKYVKLKTTTAGKYTSKKKLKLKVICEIDVARYVSSNSKWYGN